MSETETPQQVWRDAERGDASALEALLTAGALTLEGALWYAAYAGRSLVVRSLLARGADPNRHQDGMPVLAVAANMGRLSVIRELLSAGADVNACTWGGVGDPNGWTALHYAVHPDIRPDGHVGVVRALLRAGADVDARDSEGRTPLMFAVRGSWRIMDALVKAGADVNARDNIGWTPFMYAVSGGYSHSIFNLQTYGADIDVRDHKGRSALVYAGCGPRGMTWNIVDDLLRAGIRVSADDRDTLLADLDDFRHSLERRLNESSEPGSSD